MNEANKKYQQLFIDEAQEHLQTLNSSLLDFEKNPTDTELAEGMMRAAHTLKGMAASMGYKDIENLTHQTEDLLENLRTGKEKATPQIIQSAFDNIDKLEKLVKEESTDRPEAFAPITTIKVGVEKLDALMNLTEELLVNRMRLGQIASSQNWSDLPTALDSLDRFVSDLQYTVMQSRLVPVEQIFNRFPRMVRDLGKKEEKEVELKISGSEIELDRTLINQIGEPLVHLLRNAVDHGIEKQGVITLTAKREKGVAIIEIEDDGKGIDWQAITKTQKHKNTKTQKPEDLLFSGISTSEKVTEVSGRGVGLSVVKTKVEEVGGQVKVKSPVNETRGTRFTLELPLSLAIAQALLIKVGEEKFAIPVADVDRLVRLEKEQIKRTANIEAAVIAKEDVPLLHLSSLFDNVVEKRQNSKSSILAVLVKIPASTTGGSNQTVGFVVDEVLSEQDIIIKPLTGILREQKGLSGATILGDGSVVLILDVTSIIEIQNEGR